MTNTEISNADKIMLGDTEALAMYIGSTQIWQSIQLPYDAEIEYLESSGTQYINTNCQAINVGVSGEIIMQRTGSSGSELCYIGRTESGGFDIQTDSSKGISLWVKGVGYVSSGNTYFDTIKHTVTFSIESNNINLSIDGNQYSVSGTPGSSLTANIQIFGHCSRYGPYGRIYSCKIYVNNILSLDLIPVRIGQVGYMYNKIDGQLFENNGTGSFILGPDL